MGSSTSTRKRFAARSKLTLKDGMRASCKDSGSSAGTVGGVAWAHETSSSDEPWSISPTRLSKDVLGEKTLETVVEPGDRHSERPDGEPLVDGELRLSKAVVTMSSASSNCMATASGDAQSRRAPLIAINILRNALTRMILSASQVERPRKSRSRSSRLGPSRDIGESIWKVLKVFSPTVSGAS